MKDEKTTSGRAYNPSTRKRQKNETTSMDGPTSRPQKRDKKTTNGRACNPSTRKAGRQTKKKRKKEGGKEEHKQEKEDMASQP